MPRIRTIKPTFFRSQEMAELPLSARLTYIGLWTYVDDEGKGLDDARLIKGDLWQLDEKHTTKKVESDLALLAERGHLERYEVGGRRYLRVPAWKKHQRINRPSKSIYPDPISDDSLNPHGRATDPSSTEGKGREGNKERKGDEPAPSGLGFVGSPDPRFACDTRAPLAPSGGGSVRDTKLDEQQKAVNRQGIDAAKQLLRGAS